MSRFQVLFSGEVAVGAAETAVRQNLVRRLGLDERKVSQLFSGRTVVIRSDLTREAAEELQAELAQLGAIARIKDTSPDEKAKFAAPQHSESRTRTILSRIWQWYMRLPRPIAVICAVIGFLFLLNVFSGLDDIWFHWPVAPLLLIVVLLAVVRRKPS